MQKKCGWDRDTLSLKFVGACIVNLSKHCVLEGKQAPHHAGSGREQHTAMPPLHAVVISS